MSTGPVILVVQGGGRNRLTKMLESHGFVVHRALNGKQAVARLKECSPAVAVIDPSSLRINSVRLSHMLRRADGSVPIIWVLEPGGAVAKDGIADLWLERPVTARKLLHRVRKLLPTSESDTLTAGDFVFDVEARVVQKGGQTQRLTPKQASLLEELMRHSPEVLSRRYLMKTVWNTDYLGDTRTLDVHIRWVREAIEDDPSAPEYVLTVRGVGYRFESPGAEMSEADG
jgi:DNA-binding response OmpR family regulator